MREMKSGWAAHAEMSIYHPHTKLHMYHVPVVTVWICLPEVWFTFCVFTCSSYCETYCKKREWWGLPRPPTEKRRSEWLRLSTPDGQKRKTCKEEGEGEKPLFTVPSEKRSAPLHHWVSPILVWWSRECRLWPRGGSLLWTGGWQAPRRGTWLWNKPPEKRRDKTEWLLNTAEHYKSEIETDLIPTLYCMHYSQKLGILDSIMETVKSSCYNDHTSWK